MARPTLGHVLLAAPLVAVTAWVMLRGRAALQDPAAVLAALRAAHGPHLPAPTSAGAASSSDPASYDRETLYQFIDGAADGYLARGFERCVAATFNFPGSSTLDIDAEAYRFAEPTGARAQLEAERPRAAHPVMGLTDAWADDTTLVVVSGRDYLKLTALSPRPAAETAMTRLAMVWAEEQRR